MSAPFIIKAEDSSDTTKRYYSIATGPGLTNVTSLTTIVVADATGSKNLDAYFDNYSPNELKLSAEKMPASAKVLQTALAPLLALYNAQNIDIVNGPFQANHTGIDAVMDSVKVAVSNGTITISTMPGITSPSVSVFTAQAGSITQGKLDLNPLQNPPAPHIGGSALYTSKCAGCHGDIASTNLKSRATLALTKGAITSNRGGMGMLSGLADSDIQGIIDSISSSSSAPTAPSSPSTSQAPAQSASPAPSPAAPASDGTSLYEANCAECHGSLAASRKTGATVVRLQNAISGDVGGMSALSTLTSAEINAIVLVLNPGGSTPAAVPPAPVPSPTPSPAPSPTPMPGTPPAIDGATEYSTDCSGCHRPLATSTKIGITTARLDNAITSNVGGMSFLSGLTSVIKDAIVAVLAPVLPSPSPAPTPAPTPAPVPASAPVPVDGVALYSANCAGCHGSIANSSKRGVPSARLDSAISGNIGGMSYLSGLSASERQAIIDALAVTSSPPPAPAPTPSPIPAPTPNPTPADGAALYSVNCAGCHGSLASSSKSGITISRLQNAINSNIAGMGSFSSLTVSEIQSIVTALTPSTPTPVPTPGPAPTPTPVDGATLYTTNCAGCHGTLATSGKSGATTIRIQNAISGNIGNMGFLSTLSASDISAIAAALPAAAPVPTPATVDGATLYTINCAGCHGALATSAKAGATTTRIQNAISGNIGNMGFLSTLSASNISAIVAALPAAAPVPTPTPTPTPVDGATLYTTNCAGCHGTLATSAKAGATTTRIQTAVNGNIGGMGYLSTLTSANLSAIASALATVTPSPTPAPVCGSCHAIPPATAKHSTHKSQNIACSTCHGSGYSTTTVNASTHNNGVKNIDTVRTGWNPTTRTCSNSCHGTKTWK
jgi:mono/diheme cytochrome c family protein